MTQEVGLRPFTEALEEAVSADTKVENNDKLGPQVREVPLPTPIGTTDPAFSIVRWKGKEYPTLIYHHGNNERPYDYKKTAKNSFYSLFYRNLDSVDANLINLRVSFHNSTLEEYTERMQYLEQFTAMMSASVCIIEGLVAALHRTVSAPVFVSGISLGGWITTMHRSYFNTADCYIPLFAGPA